MTQTVEAVYTGDAMLRLDSDLDIEPNTRVEITVTVPDKALSRKGRRRKGKPGSFLAVADSPKIKGPPDWSANVDKYLYGEDLHGSS